MTCSFAICQHLTPTKSFLWPFSSIESVTFTSYYHNPSCIIRYNRKSNKIGQWSLNRICSIVSADLEWFWRSNNYLKPFWIQPLRKYSIYFYDVTLNEWKILCQIFRFINAFNNATESKDSAGAMEIPEMIHSSIGHKQDIISKAIR